MKLKLDIEKLVKEYPNDMELGSKIREIYLQNEKRINTRNY